MRLMREVRCFPDANVETAHMLNTWAGPVDNAKLATFWMIRAVVDGPVDEQTGYLCDIKRLDAILYGVVIRRLLEQGTGRRNEVSAAATALLESFPPAAERCSALGSLQSLELRVSPFMSFTVYRGDRRMVRLTRSFEFCASHRLYRRDFSDEENRRIFGKCSNPHGHGHNYVLEVTVSGTPDELSGTVVDPPHLDPVVRERVIDPFDHKNLNIECAEFSSLNPSVENIAHVIWNRLEGALERCRLICVRVWETPKTYAEYTGCQED